MCHEETSSCGTDIGRSYHLASRAIRDVPGVPRGPAQATTLDSSLHQAGCLSLFDELADICEPTGLTFRNRHRQAVCLRSGPAAPVSRATEWSTAEVHNPLMPC